MTTFYLIRHGEKEKGPGDPGLSTHGKDQAKRTAHFLQRFPISAIYTSPFQRTKDTAAIIAEKLQVFVTIEPLLKERMNWERDDQEFEDFIKEWEYATRHPDFTPKAGDSVRTTAKRLQQVMVDLAKINADNHIALVTHGGTIRDFLSLHSEDTARLLAERNMEGIQECSISTVLYDGVTFTLENIDDTTHLF